MFSVLTDILTAQLKGKIGQIYRVLVIGYAMHILNNHKTLKILLTCEITVVKLYDFAYNIASKYCAKF